MTAGALDRHAEVIKGSLPFMTACALDRHAGRARNERKPGAATPREDLHKQETTGEGRPGESTELADDRVH
jgi:hypothetical protein